MPEALVGFVQLNQRALGYGAFDIRQLGYSLVTSFFSGHPLNGMAFGAFRLAPERARAARRATRPLCKFKNHFSMLFSIIKLLFYLLLIILLNSGFDSNYATRKCRADDARVCLCAESKRYDIS